MGQALKMCRGCQFTTMCYQCTDLHNWIMEHMETKWISVKDRMPDAFQPVIVHVRHTEKWRNTMLTDLPWHVVEEDIWLGDKWSNNADDDIHEVTHWMPMPEPPNEVLE